MFYPISFSHSQAPHDSSALSLGGYSNWYALTSTFFPYIPEHISYILFISHWYPIPAPFTPCWWKRTHVSKLFCRLNSPSSHDFRLVVHSLLHARHRAPICPLVSIVVALAPHSFLGWSRLASSFIVLLRHLVFFRWTKCGYLSVP